MSIRADERLYAFRYVAEWFERNPPVPGEMDLWMIERHLEAPTAEAILACLLLLSRQTEEGLTAHFQRITVVAPPSWNWDSTHQAVCEVLLEIGRGAERAAIERWVAGQIVPFIATTLQSDEVELVLRSAASGDAVVVIRGAAWEPRTVIPEPGTPVMHRSPTGQVIFSSYEGQWIARVEYLANGLRAVGNNCYVLVLVDQVPEEGGQVGARLLPLFDGVNTVARNLRHSLPENQVQEWTDVVRLGRTDLFEESLSSYIGDDDIRAQIRMQIYPRAGYHQLAWKAIEPYVQTWLVDPYPPFLLSVARVAMNATHVKVARQVVRVALENADDDAHLLRIAHQLAENLADTNLMTLAMARLLSRYPEAPYTRHLRFHAALEGEQWGEVLNIAERSELEYDDRQFVNAAVARSKLETGQLSETEYWTSISEQAPSFRDSAARVLCWCALERREINIAYDIISTKTESISEDRARALIDIIDKAMLAEDTPPELLETLVHDLIAQVSRFPGSGDLRVRATKVLDPARVGHIGQAMTLLIPFTTPPPLEALPKANDIAPPHVASDIEASDDDLMRFMNAYATEGNVSGLLVPSRIPRQLLDKPPRALADRAIVMLQNMVANFISGPDDIRPILILLRVTMDLVVTSHEDPQEGALEVLEATLLVAQGFAVAGLFQEARNLAEHILRSAMGASILTRIRAWLGFSDIYLRCHSLHEALVGLSCLHSLLQFEGLKSLRARDAFDICHLRIRAFREIGALGNALDEVSQCIAILPDPSSEASRMQWLAVLVRAQLLMSNVSSFESHDALGLAFAELIGETTDEIERQFSMGETLTVPLHMHAQLIRFAKIFAIGLPVKAVGAFERALAVLPGDVAGRIRQLAAEKVGVDDLLKRARIASRAFYAEDLVSDMVEFRLLASGVLRHAVENNQPVEAITTIELLTDLAIRRTSGVESEAEEFDVVLKILQGYEAQAVRGEAVEKVPEKLVDLRRESGSAALDMLSSPDQTLDMMEQLVSAGMEVNWLGVIGESVAWVHAVAGEPLSAQVLPNELFSMSAVRRWRIGYPVGYRDMDPTDPDGLVAMEGTMSGIGLPDRPMDGCTGSVFVMESRIADVPAQLVLRDGQIGADHGPIAVVPSLSWLRSSATGARVERGERWAWLLPSDTFGTETDARNDALSILADRIPQVVEPYGFKLDGVPFSKGKLIEVAMVVGHGHVDSDSHFLATVRDGAGNAYRPTDLARRIAPAALVLLLVCSAGRLDSVHGTLQTVGLSRDLVDRGVRAVVASRWPIDAVVVGYWVEAFLPGWESGQSLLEAVHRANQAVRHLYSHPRDWASMTVYGDPLLSLVGLERG